MTPFGVAGSWSLAFDDEFNGTSLDRSKWEPYWFNASMWLSSSITDPHNVSVANGQLTLTLASATDGALVDTNPSAGVSPGYQMGCNTFVEGRIEFPGSGTTIYDWPGFWTSSQNWPATGETDIFEAMGGTATSNYHSGGPTHSNTNIANNSGPIPGSWGGTWHTYGVDRLPTQNIIYWDGHIVRSYPTYDNCAPQYLLVNIGAGSTQSAIVTGAQIHIDYIRTWTAN